jgi:hypothetical protein
MGLLEIVKLLQQLQEIEDATEAQSYPAVLWSGWTILLLGAAGFAAASKAGAVTCGTPFAILLIASGLLLLTLYAFMARKYVHIAVGFTAFVVAASIALLRAEM